MTRIQANLVLLTVGALWGMGFVAQSTAMEAIGPFFFVGLRFSVAALSMLPFALRETSRAEQALSVANWRVFAFIGVLLFGGMAAQQTGLMTTTVTNSGFLTGLYVVMVPLLAVTLFRQSPHPAVWPAALLALAGIWFLSGGEIGALTVGDWLTVLCAVFWALQLIFIARHASRTGRPVTLAVVQFAVCGVLGLAVAFSFETVDWSAVRHAAPEILFTGIFSGGIAFTLQAVGQRYTTAPQAAIFLASEAVFAALFGIWLLGERLPASGFLGCALILAAILIVELAPTIRRKKPVTT
ncbi:EamA-like transporter family protein [Mesorhizobium albiziae]|uniref:EamA-like transporter family protein n=1 Tax=Neomesorhizobium albiziae TaxID=335020 RepID=A0A1I3ZFG8_9HYPH|nr:DMT family transporter [Mesorhizobium albiziae]GLS32188.1 MFS transporter [Mesorhizobium albiziae]SFK42864.1 EamA-like transporter family protein [Mesorhizobium albiziae]